MGYIIAGVMSVFGGENNVDFVTHWDLDLNSGQTVSEHSSYRTCQKAKEGLALILEVDLDQLTCKISRTYGE